MNRDLRIRFEVESPRARGKAHGIPRQTRENHESPRQGLPFGGMEGGTGDARREEGRTRGPLAEPPLPALHPQMAEVFRQKATTLAAGLEHDEQRDAARQALRGFLDKIVIPRGHILHQALYRIHDRRLQCPGVDLRNSTAPGFMAAGHLHIAVPGDEDDRHVRPIADLLLQLEAVEAGNRHVENQTTGRGAARMRQKSPR